MKNLSEAGYNERLFAGGFRTYLHLGRYKWLQRCISLFDITYDSVIELGCFDGKLIEFLPRRPARYLGLDANWEGGLDIAGKKWGHIPEFTFQLCNGPEDIVLDPGDQFDIVVIMETLEHLPQELLHGYLRKIAQHTKGYVFITVPNERGPVFLSKWMIKKTFSNDAEQYSFSEVVNATLGRMQKVQRREHKGFDYKKLIEDIGLYFDVLHISGIPLNFLPPSLNFGVGILGKKQRKDGQY